ncbi:MAG: hypothetical protein AMJ89_00550 [candidate division Zixibacteria bacterium SM23_73]|nr:MAG: hypothetical protein AMJ89_00550 [candidate division Zixibacteria bacterium SM23_73]
MKKRIIIFLLVCTALVITIWGDKPPKDELRKILQNSKDPNSIVVMTRNIYVGGYVDRILHATDPAEIPFLVTETFQEVLSTNFYYRAEALVDEIMREQPHLIGLQEISLIRRQTPGDYLLGGSVPATEVVFDYLQILSDAIAMRGLEYDVAGIIKNFDVEMPMFVGPDPYNPLCYDDARLTDFDVVLAREGVEILDVLAENYEDYISFVSLPIKRGFVAVDAKVGHKTYKFVNTHLEPDDIDVQMDQAMELMTEYLNDITLPIIVVGDLNTEAPTGETYQMFLTNGYVDAWTRNLIRPRTPGLTNPHDWDLRNTEVNFEKRIDLIMVKSHVGMKGIHNIGPVFAYVVGDELEDRYYFEYDSLHPWLWPSDHAGVVALLRIPILGHHKGR